MARIYMERLIKTVIELSHGNDWDTAVVEWESTADRSHWAEENSS